MRAFSQIVHTAMDLLKQRSAAFGHSDLLSTNARRRASEATSFMPFSLLRFLTLKEGKETKLTLVAECAARPLEGDRGQRARPRDNKISTATAVAAAIKNFFGVL